MTMPQTMPHWWDARRFGLLVQASVAAVPGFAPIGEDAGWYRSHLGDDVADSEPHPRPAVEVVAHHHDRWGHVDEYDDFAPLLMFDGFDPENWARLVAESGANYAVFTAKNVDGWAWWDAPGSRHRLTETGPRRDVVAEFAAACERNGIVFGTTLSLLDWGDKRSSDVQTGPTYVAEALHPQALDLVERHGSSYLRGDGGWGHDAGHWRSAELLGRIRRLDPEIVVNDGWRAPHDPAATSVTTYDSIPPAEIADGPWELVRPISTGFGYNRAEQAEHHLDGAAIVSLYTEVVAKGGNLLLGIAPDADGVIVALQSEPLRHAGEWIRSHGDVLAATRPWTTWGDRDVRYLDAGNSLLVVDVGGAGRFAALDRSSVTIREVVDLATGAPMAFRHDDALVIDIRHRDAGLGAGIYRVTYAPVDEPGTLFAADDPAPIPLGPLLTDARPGSIVQLGDGIYEGPVTIPPGVTLRGLGPHRTIIRLPSDSPRSIVPDPSVVRLESTSRLEHLRVSDRPNRGERFPRPIVAADGAGSTVLGCTVDGSVVVSGDDVLLRAVTGRGVVVDAANGLHVSRCRFTGRGSDVGIDVRGGQDLQIDSTELFDHLCAVRVTGCSGPAIRGNTIRARWWGVHVDHSTDAHVHANRIEATMRAVDVDGGSGAVVDGNAVTDGDSGCIVEDGAADCSVYGNHWDRCRIGLLAWEAVGLRHQDNVASSLHEPESAFVDGP